MGDGNTSCSSFGNQDLINVAMVSAISGSLSVISSSLVIALIILFKKWAFLTQRLVLYLATSSLLNAISQILHRVNYHHPDTPYSLHTFDSNFCIFGGFLEQSTSWMLLNSILIITVYLFSITVFKRHPNRLEILYLFVIFALPLLISLIPFIKSSYGPSGAWCWIRVQDPTTCKYFAVGQAFMIALWFVPSYIILIILIVMYAAIIVSLYKHKLKKNWRSAETAETVHLMAENRKKIVSLIVYPSIYFVLMIFPLINRIESGKYRNRPTLVLWYLAAISYPLAGGVLGVAYALDKETRQRLTWAHFRGAIRQWTMRDSLKEYPITHDLEEEALNNGEEEEEKKGLLSGFTNSVKYV